jgi:hypothetical protein
MVNGQRGHPFPSRVQERIGTDEQRTGPTLDKLCKGRLEAEAERQGAEFYNFGKGTTDCSVYSKTSKGHLVSDIDSRTMQVTHRWQSYGCQPPWYWRVRAEEARGLVNERFRI